MEEQKKQNNTIAEKLLDNIRNGRIKMRPKMYFVMRSMLLGMVAVVLFLFAIYLVSFMFFIMRLNGGMYLFNFGFFGLGRLLMALPWWLIVISLGLILILEVFAEKISFVYRRPVSYSLLAIIVVVILTGFVLGRTPLHKGLFETAREGHLPFIGQFYRQEELRPQIPDVFAGAVISVSSEGFFMQTSRNETLEVELDKNNPHTSKLNIKKGEALIVAGKRIGNSVQAMDVRRIDEDPDLFRPPHFIKIELK